MKISLTEIIEFFDNQDPYKQFTAQEVTNKLVEFVEKERKIRENLQKFSINKEVNPTISKTEIVDLAKLEKEFESKIMRLSSKDKDEDTWVETRNVFAIFRKVLPHLPATELILQTHFDMACELNKELQKQVKELIMQRNNTAIEWDKFKADYTKLKVAADEKDSKIKTLMSNTILAVSLPVDIDKVMRLDQPYSLPEVLKALVECADTLLHEKSYDRGGWERLEYCYRHGKDIIELFEPKELN